MRSHEYRATQLRESGKRYLLPIWGITHFTDNSARKGRLGEPLVRNDPSKADESFGGSLQARKRLLLFALAVTALAAVAVTGFVLLRQPSVSTTPARRATQATTAPPALTPSPGLTAPFSPAVKTPPPAPTPTTTLKGEVGPPGGEGAATDLRAVPGCSGEDVPVANLSWTPASRPGEEQVIVITQFPNGFESGRFSSSPGLGPEVSSYRWRGIEPGVVYNWRVLTRHGGTYTPSETGSFRGPDCLADR